MSGGFTYADSTPEHCRMSFKSWAGRPVVRTGMNKYGLSALACSVPSSDIPWRPSTLVTSPTRCRACAGSATSAVASLMTNVDVVMPTF